jgi:signal transduction protein with GAF and PtsI domain
MTGLERRVQKLTSILEIAKGITSVRDLDRLLHMLVMETTRIAEAERSSLFIYDRERNELWSKVAQGTREIRFPASMGIAGAVVKTGQVSNIPDAYEDPRFNRSVDQQTGYRTRSILTVPMRDTAGEIVGALQTLNKRGPEGEPLAFDAQDEEFLLALAGVAASAVANAMLLDDIERLFEGFAKAAVLAIESRDPTTAGHSGRVAQVSVALAEAVDRTDGGRFKDFRFTKDQMKLRRAPARLRKGRRPSGRPRQSREAVPERHHRGGGALRDDPPRHAGGLDALQARHRHGRRSGPGSSAGRGRRTPR